MEPYNLVFAQAFINKTILSKLINSLKASLKITLIIFFLMILIELFVLKYKHKIVSLLNRNLLLNYLIGSLFGIIPGCIGTFAMDSMYMTGLLSFGGLTATLISTSGDEAFLMISLALQGKIPYINIVYLTIILFILGLIGGFIADMFIKKYKIKVCKKCKIIYHKKDEFKFKHFIKEHVYKHIIKKHIIKIFFWIFIAIFLISLFNSDINNFFNNQNKLILLIIASLIAILPISGPNVFLIMLYSEGLIPFSILLANSIIQDGHGLLPILGFSIEDSLKLKIFNFIFGFLIGLILLLIGF